MLSDHDLNSRRERAGLNQTIFRQVNDRMEELSEKFHLQEETLSCVCECADPTCVERIQIPHEEYKRIRRHPAEFIVKPGHEIAEVEEIISRDARWLIVRKIGTAAQLAVELEKSDRS